MPQMRSVIINADDFGQSPGINRGVAACHDACVVTSASLMVRWAAAAEAAAYAREHPALSVGLHVDLCEWTCAEGHWRPLYEVAALDDAAAVRREVFGQLETFRRLVGGDPTHIDSHQHVHLEPVVRDIVLEMAGRLGVPVRGAHVDIRYDGSFYGQGKDARPEHDRISLERFVALINELPDGITEVGCHPALGRDVSSVYLIERELEAAVLCDRRARDAIMSSGVMLTSFRQLQRPPSAGAPHAFFDGLWQDGDPWRLETSAYDQGKYARELDVLGPRRFERVLEIGCGAGAFTRRLAAIAERVVAIDASAAAINRARASRPDPRIEYRVTGAVELDPLADGPWDLIVLSETIYYVGWQHSFFEVGWLARQLAASLRQGGVLLMTNTIGSDDHPLQMNSLLATYRDLFVNSGLAIETTQIYRGEKNGAPLEAVITLFRKR